MKSRCLFLITVLMISTGVATFAGCGDPDCPCDFSWADGGADAGPDWFDVYYAECVDMCSAAEVWGEECGWPAMMEGCVEWLWWQWIKPMQCEGIEACYEALRGANDCSGGPFEEGWRPPTWSGGNCPVQVP